MTTLVLPEDERRVAMWRVGLLAYRKAARQTVFHHDRYAAGRTAILEAFPDVPLMEAARHMSEALAWASHYHREWLNRGAMKREWIWPPDHRGVGIQRNPGYEDE